MVTQKLEVARLLLKRGADVEHCDGDGTSVLMSIGNRSIAGINHQANNTGESAFLVACGRGDLEITQLLLQNGADWTVQDLQQ
jgi:ankyrin repeat protein